MFMSRAVRRFAQAPDVKYADALFASECKRYEFRRDAASSNWDDDELP